MITAVIIKNVTLPANISEQMSGKTLVISSVAEQKMNQQYDMQQVRCCDHRSSIIDHRSSIIVIMAQ